MIKIQFLSYTKNVMSKNNGTNEPKKAVQSKKAAPTSGGELHQIAGGKHPELTTNQGVPISDNQNSLKANPRGPTLLEDFVLREKITHFDHERIPERVVHARGTGAPESDRTDGAGPLPRLQQYLSRN